jgi:uncharacterized protein YdeI (YjbR/CyaY-like superfamily)
MGIRNPEVDQYIDRAADSARPVLAYLRDVVHDACPEVGESIKWGCPHFTYRGRLMCSMAAFQRHCTFGFRRHREVVGVTPDADSAMGQFGRIRTLADVPARRKLAGFVRKAMKLNEPGAPPRSKPAPKPAPVLPKDVAAMLAQRKHADARRTWSGFTDAMRREYLDWIGEAKSDATRRKRIARVAGCRQAAQLEVRTPLSGRPFARIG